MTRHILKVNPQFWLALLDGSKRFDLRRNDRKFAVGDFLTLCEYDPQYGHTGKTRETLITYLLMPEDCPGLLPGFCILGIERVL